MNTTAPHPAIQHKVKAAYTQDDRYAAIGRLITAYAVAEGTALLALRVISGMGEEEGKIAFAGMRLSDVSDRLRRLQKLRRKPDDEEELDSILVQLSKIGSERGRIAHRHVKLDGGPGIVVSNHLVAKSHSLVEEYSISMEDLFCMYEDCSAISMRLIVLVYKDVLGQDVWERSRKVFCKPWLYNVPKR